MDFDESSLQLDFEPFVTDQLSISLEVSRKKKVGVCRYYLKGQCPRGSRCPFRHSRTVHTVVCKHWLRGLCKKGEHCEFLHEYNLKKMPECYFFVQYGECSNAECLYLHVDPKNRVRECPWYAQGFCRLGPNCRSRHVKKTICLRYVTGFCPLGANCEFVHPKFESADYRSVASGGDLAHK